jgi:hypothetical protein
MGFLQVVLAGIDDEGKKDELLKLESFFGVGFCHFCS